MALILPSPAPPIISMSVNAVLPIQFHTPRVPELLAGGIVRDVLVSGKHVWQATHIASTLHVILAAQGIDPRARRPILPVSIARLARERTLSMPVVCWVMPIAYRMADLFDLAYISAAFSRAFPRMPVVCSTFSGGYSFTFFKASNPSVRSWINSFFPAFHQDDIHHPVNPGHIGARTLTQMQIGIVSQLNAPRFYNYDFSASLFSP